MGLRCLFDFPSANAVIDLVRARYYAKLPALNFQEGLHARARGEGFWY